MKSKLKMLPHARGTALLFLCVLLLFAYGANARAEEAEAAAASAAEAPKSTCRYALCFINLTDSYNTMMAYELKAAVMEQGDEAVILDANYSNMRQCSQIRQAIREGIDGVFVQAVNAAGIVDVLEECRYAGVPVIAIDKEPSDMTWVDSYCGTDQLQAGRAVVESLKALYPEGKKLLLLTREEDEVCVTRIDSITNALFLSPFEIIGSANCDGSRSGAKEAAAGLIEKHHDAEIIVTASDSMAVGALSALEEKENTSVRIISIGGSPDIKKEMAEGEERIIGTAALSPLAVANTSAGLMKALKEGQKLKSRYLVETFLMTAENVGNYGLDTWQ